MTKSDRFIFYKLKGFYSTLHGKYSIIAEWNASVKSSMRQSPWCSVCMSRSNTVGEVLSLLINQLRISDMESARLWAIEIDGKKSRKLLDKDSLTLHDLKIVSFAQVSHSYTVPVTYHAECKGVMKCVTTVGDSLLCWATTRLNRPIRAVESDSEQSFFQRYQILRYPHRS